MHSESVIYAMRLVSALLDALLLSLAFAVARIERQLREGGADENSVTRVVNANGDIRYLVGNSDAQRGPGGEITSVIGTAPLGTIPANSKQSTPRARNRSAYARRSALPVRTRVFETMSTP